MCHGIGWNFEVFSTHSNPDQVPCRRMRIDVPGRQRSVRSDEVDAHFLDTSQNKMRKWPKLSPTCPVVLAVLTELDEEFCTGAVAGPNNKKLAADTNFSRELGHDVASSPISILQRKTTRSALRYFHTLLGSSSSHARGSTYRLRSANPNQMFDRVELTIVATTFSGPLKCDLSCDLNLRPGRTTNDVLLCGCSKDNIDICEPNLELSAVNCLSGLPVNAGDEQARSDGVGPETA